MRIRKYLIVILLLFILASCFKQEVFDKKKDDNDPLLARINDEEVYLSDLLNYFNLSRDSLRKNRQMKKNYIEQYINDRIIYLESQKHDVNISEEEVKKALTRELDNPDELSKEEYDDLFASKKKNLLVERLITSRFEVEIKEKDLKKYYKENYQEFYTPEMISIKQIFLNDPEIAKKVHKLAKSGDDFVINNKSSGIVSQFIYFLQETGFRFYDSEVSYYWFDKDTCNFVAEFFNRLFERFDIISIVSTLKSFG